MDEKKSDSFVNETIKQKPINKMRLFKKSMFTVVSAVVFGFVACLTFLLLEPVISKQLSPEEIVKIELPEEDDEIGPEELLTDEIVEQEDVEREEQFNDRISEHINEKISEQIQQEVIDGDMAIRTYQAAYDALYEVAGKAARMTVLVTGRSKDTDWFLNEVENSNETSGVVIAKTETALYVLADINGLLDAQNYTVTLPDGGSAQTKLFQYDKDTELGIFTVEKEALTKEQWESQEVIAVANSQRTELVGRPVVAVGSPLGQSGSICYGIITSNKKVKSYADCQYNILTTDITGSETNPSGIIVNTSGKLIGVITSESASAASGPILACFGISDIKGLIEKLSNNEERAYFGIHGISVTEDIQKTQNIPTGVYVTEVDTGSPAFGGGISNGDIIVGIDETDIRGMYDYMDAIESISTEEYITMRYAHYDGTGYEAREAEIKPEMK